MTFGTMRRRHWKVALLAEGVDRNTAILSHILHLRRSPSSRRAWIEIMLAEAEALKGQVALLAEGVDRNSLCFSAMHSQ